MDGRLERRRWLDRWMPWIVVALALAVALSIGMGMFAYLANQDRVAQINQERAANIERNCRELNERHDNTIEALDRVLAKRLKQVTTGAERQRLRESRENTALLIDALTPRRDCAALVARQVRAK